jgi:hypothetical protein
MTSRILTPNYWATGPAGPVLDHLPAEWRRTLFDLESVIWHDTVIGTDLLDFFSGRADVEPAGRAASVEFAQQCLMAPRDITPEQRAAAIAEIGERGLAELAFVVGVFDCLRRAGIETTPDRDHVARVAPLDDAGQDVGPHAVLAEHSPRLASVRIAVYAVCAQSVNGTVIRELIRLVSANSVDCRLCRNTRKQAALDEGLTEDDIQLLRVDGERALDLDRDGKALLAVARAFSDDRAPDEYERGLIEQLTPAQVAEALFDLIKYRSSSTITIAYGLEPDGEQPIYR